MYVQKDMPMSIYLKDNVKATPNNYRPSGYLSKYIETGNLANRELRNDIFEIVIVDSTDPINNQNVYLELGYAMGMGKDVLLICENAFLQFLPSDLNNWQTITFQRNNFIE